MALSTRLLFLLRYPNTAQHSFKMSLPVSFAVAVWVRTTFSSAGFTLLVYDYVLTLRDEVTYIWNAPWTVVKVMFFINRYGNLAAQTFISLEESGLLADNSQSFCRKFALITTIFMLLSSESIHILVLMRAWAIWGTRERTKKIFIWSYVIYCLVQLGGAMGTLNRRHIFYFQYLDVVGVCVGRMPKFVWLSTFGRLGSFAMSSFHILKTIKLHSQEFRVLYPSGLVHVLVRDAIIFFVVSILSDGLTIASWTAFSDSPKYLLAKGFANPLLSVAGQRLVLNLRGLKTRTYETRDLSCEVDRQIQAAFGNVTALDNDDPEIEQGRGCEN
ncbi:hypothetical protein K503DRAFT_320674 [Rhizopogon vinicolor AM-OR11-026]|uniref:DUF6533 domain-containing protein n=1 Tax=Rhizopogon vinicolor AM-OR11-026 TaxID=1314800 RepID=A0A1B7MUA7_9AGAM|nr:hypothetical protein K503DRAFT_320674 [Rhizopogon vinicolor AM-OR11-026]